MKTKRTLLGIVAGTVVVAGTIGGAAPAFAASTGPASVTSHIAVPAATPVNNFGLDTADADSVEYFLQAYWGYTGGIDGVLGRGSWQALQRMLHASWRYNDPIDGVPGRDTVEALQRMLQAYYGYNGKIDGIPGPGTDAAFRQFAESSWA